MQDTLSDQIRKTETPILIVGAGAAGLSAAATLARYGVDCLILDARVEPVDHPRATLISIRSMELFRSWSLEAAIRAHDFDVEPRGSMGPTLRDPVTTIPLGVPSGDQAAVLSPTGPAAVPQDDLEPVLRSYVRALPAATLELGSRLIDLRQRRTRVEAQIEDADGRVRTVHAHWALATDGANSDVRRSLGIAMSGPGTVADGITSVFRAPLWERLADRGLGRYLLYPMTGETELGTFVPGGRGDRWIYGYAGEPGTLRKEDVDPNEFLARIRSAAGFSDLPISALRIGHFTYTALLAETFRSGRVFLAGDAAHRVTPRGGTGMNTAIADGHDIGWKLAWVALGWAGEDLLDTYERERRPVAAHNVERSAGNNGSTREPVEELHVDLGGRIPHLWIGEGTERRSTLDLLGPGLTSLGTAAAIPASGHAAGPPVRHRALSPIAARALGIPSGGSILVRPDGVRIHGDTGFRGRGEAEAAHAHAVAAAIAPSPRRQPERCRAITSGFDSISTEAAPSRPSSV